MDNEKFGIWGRTNLGEIFKFAWIEDSSGVVYDRKIMLLDNDGNNPEEYCLNYEEHIIKHSKKIIDLIEEGDYVNGELITDKWDTRVSSIRSNFSEEDIKTILTKESYMANCYKVGGEDE